MSQIEVSKHNELYLKLSGEKRLLFEISEFFSFQMEGYQFTPSYKLGKWDGKIRLFNFKTGLLPSGLLNDLVNFCAKMKLGVHITKLEDMCPLKYKTELDEYTSNLFSYTNLVPQGVYQYQLNAFRDCIELNKALVLSPTGSGKSHIIYMIVRFLIKYTKVNTLICVPSTSLVEQIVGDFSSYVNDNFNVDAYCHKIYSGKEKLTDKRITVSTWQSLYKQPKEWFKRFGCFICDEAHQANKDSISTIINHFETAPFRYGFTGTLDGSKTHELALRGMFGSVLKTTTTKKLMNSGVLAKLDIEIVILQYSLDEKKHIRQKCQLYSDEIKWLVENDNRNKYILASAFAQKNNTLVLFNFVDDHGKKLFEKAQQLAPELGKEVFIVHGDVEVSEREDIRKLVELQDNVIIFASSQCFSTGINIKNLHTIIFAHPYKSRIRNLQSIGRALRLNSGKTTAKLIDIADDLTYNLKPNYTLAHLTERIKIYKKEQFDYVIKQREL